MKLKNIAAATLVHLFIAIGAFGTAPANNNFANAQVLTGMQAHISGTNVDATKETGEPNHAGSQGGKSVWYKWTAPMSRVMQITTNRSPENLNTLLHIYSGTSFANFVNQGGNNNIDSSNSRSRVVIQTEVGTTYYIALDGFNDGTSAAAGSFTFDMQPYFIYQGADFDDDGTTDLSVFRPSTGAWIVKGTTHSSTTFWGTNGDIPLITFRSFSPAQTVFRPTDGIWYQHSGGLTDRYIRFGTAGDIPVAESFGGSATEYSVFRPSNGVWYISDSTGFNLSYYRFGVEGDIPVPGQYSPDYFGDIAVFRPSNGTWYFTIRPNGASTSDTFRAIQFGQQGDKPIPADYDGDGMLDIAVYRPSTGTFWVLKSGNNQAVAFQWGIAEDIPTSGDFDGDGYADYAVFRPSTATWYIYRSGDGQLQVTPFGQTGDIPMTSNRAY